MCKIKICVNKFLLLLKKNVFFYLVLILSSTTFLYGISIGTSCFDGQIINEITEEITNQANISKFKYSLNSINMKEKGNSDFWTFSDNKLSDFQMRNQTMVKNKNYVFSAYVATEKYTPFKYGNISCTTILFESKFKENAFYFDLPLLAGNLPRFIDKQSIYITDKFAKIIDPSIDPSRYFDLIGKTLEGKIIVERGPSNITYKIAGVLGTNNDLGNLLINFFGNKFIFVTEHNIIPMTNDLYFFGCTDKDSNNSMVNFVMQNYKSSHGSSGGLEIGYEPNYKFYELNNLENHVLGNTNKKLNNIITTYDNNGVMLSVIGFSFATIIFIFIMITLKHEKIKYIENGKGYALFSFWMISCVSLIITSLIYNYAPIISLISRQNLLTKSTITSSGIILAWILLTLILSIIPFTKPKSIEKNIN